MRAASSGASLAGEGAGRGDDPRRQYLAPPVSPVTAAPAGHDAPTGPGGGPGGTVTAMTASPPGRPPGDGMPEEGTPEYEWLYGAGGPSEDESEREAHSDSGSEAGSRS